MWCEGLGSGQTSDLPEAHNSSWKGKEKAVTEAVDR